MHFAPHPDDELIGAPATLMALRDAGFTIVNVACSLGRPGQHARREAELQEACRRAGFELRLPEEPVSISGDVDEQTAQAELTALVLEALAREEPRIVVSPGPADRHHGHRLVALAVRDAIIEHGTSDAAPRWWMWSLWGSLPQPTIGTRFGAGRLEEILTALAAHRGELARNDYRRFVRARAEMNASLAAELLFGFGAPVPTDISYVELLTEVALRGSRWMLGTPGWLDPEDPLQEPSGVEAVLD
ncbi:MAG TPA: PIG-L family deacetylase [Solirubrobacterales bacterium]